VNPKQAPALRIGEIHPLPSLRIEEDLESHVVIRGIQLEERLRDIEGGCGCTHFER
jgi:hypothetical protein